MIQKITPNLWFNGNAKEAVDFYASVFPDVRINATSYYPKSKEEGLADFQLNMAGKVLTVDFEIMGFRFTAINAGPEFTPNPSISFTVALKSTEEIDALWAKLSEGGSILMELQEYPFSKRYGWCEDKYGVSWQLVLDDGHYLYKDMITPTFVFVGNVAGKAEEAMNFWASVFPDSKVGDLAKYPAGMEPDKEGTVMHGAVVLAGQEFFAMDSAREHRFSFNEGVSLSISCKDQGEIDYYWEKLIANGGQESVCGWLKDKYGVSWQVAPANMEELMKKPDAFKVMMQQKKIIIADYD